MRLTLYRRHIRACTKDHKQNFRFGKPRTPKELKADCECPIVVSGRLRLEPKPLRHVSTESNKWKIAEAIAAQWEEWEALTNPNSEAIVELPTVEHAIVKFMNYHGPNFKNWEPRFLQKYEIMFRVRLRPFCNAGNIQFITRFDDPSTVKTFVASWRNMNPTRNRKLAPGETLPIVPLGDRTKVKELERFRYFLEFCKDNGWLKHNHAKTNEKLKYRKPEPKFGLESGEVARVFETIELLEDCHGRTNQANYLETYAFCMVSRYTGLRINAVTNLDRTQLVEREIGNGYAIKIMEQRKSGWVRIPIPMSVYEALMALPIKGEKNGKQYWFYTANGTLETNIKTWRGRITRLFHKSQTPILDSNGKWTRKYAQPFQHHSTPHTWRHTFAILALNDGTPMQLVCRWLGHSGVAITEAHYGHANRETHIASEIAYDESLQRQKTMMEQARKREDNKIIAIS